MDEKTVAHVLFKTLVIITDAGDFDWATAFNLFGIYREIGIRDINLVSYAADAIVVAIMTASLRYGIPVVSPYLGDQLHTEPPYLGRT
jgi:hypothetical protein